MGRRTRNNQLHKQILHQFSFGEVFISSLGATLPPRDIWQCQEADLVATQGEGAGGLLLVSGGWRPGMPLNILDCTGQPSPTHSNKGFLAPNINHPSVEKPCSSPCFGLTLDPVIPCVLQQEHLQEGPGGREGRNFNVPKAKHTDSLILKVPLIVVRTLKMSNSPS